MADSDKQQNKNKGCLLVIRIMNAITAFLLIGFGIAGIIIFSVKQLATFKLFLACSPLFLMYLVTYHSLFGLMLLAADFKFKIVRKYFLFMRSFLGRGFFNIYLSTVTFFYFSCGNDSDVLAWISSSIIFVIGIAYCTMHCLCGDKAGVMEGDEKDKASERGMKDQMI